MDGGAKRYRLGTSARDSGEWPICPIVHRSGCMTQPLSKVTDADEASEQILVARVRAGDEAAFQELFFRYYRQLYTFVFGYIRSRSMAEDVVQDLLLSVWRQRADWHIRSSLRTYLFGAARNRALNLARDEHL